MNVSIDDFQPRPLTVIDKHTVTVTLTLFAMDDLKGCRILFNNKNQSTAELFDNNEENDKLESDEFDLVQGTNYITHQLGFKLQGSASSIGANITLDVAVVDSNSSVISQIRIIAVTIHAH